jgi:hypothetical protein
MGKKETEKTNDQLAKPNGEGGKPFSFFPFGRGRRPEGWPTTLALLGGHYGRETLWKTREQVGGY